MESLYLAGGTSRQSFHEWKQPSEYQLTRTTPEKVVEMARTVRENYLLGGASRELYECIRKRLPDYNQMLQGWGKHTFEAICLQKGMRVIFRRFVPKTTQRGEFVFDNLIEGMEISDINRIWFSDISYIFSDEGKLLGYATSLIDAYSRFLLGLSFSKTMHAALTSNVVIQQALNTRNSPSFQNLIFHSDGGKQYIEKRFLGTLHRFNIRSSMAKNCYENPFAEAFNDTLKNHIFHDSKFNSFDQLKKMEDLVKRSYNFFKPHSGINRMTPCEFEQHILNLKPCQRTILKIKDLN
jgi:transposase InsO family protein